MSAVNLVDLLRAQPQGFDLFQALSLLERSYEGGRQRPIGSSVGMDETVRLAAQVDLSFAASDISSVEEGMVRDGGPARSSRCAPAH